MSARKKLNQSRPRRLRCDDAAAVAPTARAAVAGDAPSSILPPASKPAASAGADVDRSRASGAAGDCAASVLRPVDPASPHLVPLRPVTPAMTRGSPVRPLNPIVQNRAILRTASEDKVQKSSPPGTCSD